MSATEGPLVSVITIFLNEERFLAEAVESVRAQSYPRWELLLCDDGSADGSAALARGYAAADPARVRYLAHPGGANRGMSATRNLGLAAARGALVAFLDGDDAWAPEKLARQVALLQRHPAAAMVYGPSLMWASWTGDPSDAGGDHLRRLGIAPDRVVRGTTMLARILDGRGESPGTCSVLVRREAAKAVGGFEDRFRGMYEDQAFFAKLFLDHDVYVMRESLDYYRQHAESCFSVALASGEGHRELPSPARAIYLQWLHGYLAGRSAPPRVRWLVRRELWFHAHPRAARMRIAWRKSVGRSLGVVLGVAFAAGRAVLPRGVRQRLWARWGGDRGKSAGAAHEHGRASSERGALPHGYSRR